MTNIPLCHSVLQVYRLYASFTGSNQELSAAVGITGSSWNHVRAVMGIAGSRWAIHYHWTGRMGITLSLDWTYGHYTIIGLDVWALHSK